MDILCTQTPSRGTLTASPRVPGPRSREDTPTGGGGALINLYSPPEVTGLSVALILSYLLGIVHGITRTSTHGR